MKKYKINFTTVFLTLSLLFIFPATTNAQLPPGKQFQDRYKLMAQRETDTMKTRYHLSSSQLTKVEKLNNAYYEEVNAALKERKDMQARQQKITNARNNRDKQLQSLLTQKQYAAYRKDMDAAALKAQQRVKEFNERAKQNKQKIRLNN